MDKKIQVLSDLDFLVPVVGLEPTRCRHRRILNPLRLPIPSHRRVLPVHYSAARAILQEKFSPPQGRTTDFSKNFKFFKNRACKREKTVVFLIGCLSKTEYPGVAKFGIALEWGSRGRWFESSHSDHVGASFISLAPAFL